MSELLPQGWEVAELGELGRWRGGGTPSKSVPAYWLNGTVHWVSPKDMKRLMIDSAEDQITLAAVKESAANLIPEDSVLMVTRSGILEHTFPVAVNTIEVAVNQDLKAWTPHVGVNPLYAAYFLKAEGRAILDGCAKDGTTVASIDFDRLKAYPVRLAPRLEQARIVSKIEELFSSIDEGERALERVRKLVERYRQSVLKAAVTGELTREWREQHAGDLESGEALLTRILEARRQAWETAEVANMKAKGIRPSSNDWKKRYKQTVSPNTNDLPELPKGWTWASLPQLGEFGRGKSKHRPRNSPTLYGGKYPFIQTGIVRSSKGNITSYTATYNDVGLAQSKLWPKGTICITIAANIAESGILGMDACFPDSIVGLVSVPGVITEYVEFFVRTERASLSRYAPATAQKNISIEILEQVAVPLPPQDEQREIYSVAQRELSKIFAIERTLSDQKTLSEALKQTILKAAFSGQLVPEDLADEPASLLLQRIASERAATPKRRVIRQVRNKKVKA